MSRKKPSAQTKSTTRKQAVADPRKQGLRAFSANSFDAAIKCWSQLDQNDQKVAAALAEAYFRRALTQTGGAERVADIRQALAYAPNDVRYQYHLGLALHRAGDIKAAIQSYNTILDARPNWSGVGMALALAELANNPRVDLAKLKGMTPSIQKALAPVQALLQGQTPPVDNQSDGMHKLWHGLGLIPAGDASALDVLNDESNLPSSRAVAVRRAYKGVALAQAGDMDKAVRLWQRVYDEKHWRPSWLADNLAGMLGDRLQAHLDADNLDEAVALAQWMHRVSFDHVALVPMVVTTLDRAAQQAASTGKWQDAALLWEDARQLVSRSSSLGSPRLLLHNLALAYEALEEWVAAAEMWRTMLRTRPRKTKQTDEEKSADPLAYTDEQWAWVRNRVVSCYKHAGEPGEAVKVFRSAIKSSPNDLDMRLQLAEALLANDQEQACLNELYRILEIDPQHIEAHLRLADIYGASNQWQNAEKSLRVVLDQQPEREDVRRQIARLMLLRGNYLHNFGMLDAAEKIFREGQQFAPADFQFPLNLARIEIDRNNMKKVAPLLEQTLELGADDPKAYIYVIDCWAAANKLAEARAVLERAVKDINATTDFFMDLAVLLLQHAMPPSPFAGFLLAPPAPQKPADGPWLTLAQEVLDQAMALQPDDPNLRFLIAKELMAVHAEMALTYAEEGVKLAPEDLDGLILLGVLQGLNKKSREAKATLRNAAKQARQQGRPDIANQADMIRQEVGSPFFSSTLQMAMMGGDIGFDDDDFDDDDLYF